MISSAKILYVNLTEKTHKVETLSSEIYRKYPGGSALGMYLLFQEQGDRAGIDPLSPANPLIFSVSPLTGIPISGQSRMCVTTKSPLTGTAGDSQVGGFIPAHIKGKVISSGSRVVSQSIIVSVTRLALNPAQANAVVLAPHCHAQKLNKAPVTSSMQG